MLAILIIGLLGLALMVVMDSRADAECERDHARMELEGRKRAQEAGKPYNPDRPCGCSSCEYPLCSFYAAGSPVAKRPSGQDCYLNDDDLNYYEDDEEEEEPDNV